MNSVVKRVRDYYKKKSELFNIDAEQLQRAVMSMSDAEMEVLKNADESSDEFDFCVHKAFYRCNDFCAGSSDLDDDGEIICSASSAITELDIKYKTYKACYDKGYVFIGDIDKEDFTGFSFEDIADLTAAIIRFEATHKVMLDE